MNVSIPILFVTDGIFPHAVGGIQRHSRLLIEALAMEGKVDISVVHPHKEVQVFDPALGIKELHTDPLPGKRNYLLELEAYSRQTHRIIQDHPHHLVYAQGLTVWHGLGDFGHRLIINPHGLEPYQPLSQMDYLKGMPYRLAFDKIFQQARHVISLGGSLSDILVKRTKGKADKLQVIPNAVNLPENQLGAEDKLTQRSPLKCLFVGRWAYNKGIDTLLEAIELIEKEGEMEGFHFSLAGKGPLWEKFTEGGERPGLEFLGFVDDEQLMNLYKENHLFVLPTRFEGMPTVVLEAMAYGAGILVTDVGATRELVDDSNGEIIPKNDAVALKNALCRMRDKSEKEWREIFNSSVQKVQQRFTWKAVARQHRELFEHLHQEMLVS